MTNRKIGSILLISFLSVNSVLSFYNHTLEDVPESYANVSDGKSLWLSLMQNCKKPTTSCIRTTMLGYLNGLLELENYKVNSYVNILKNNISYNFNAKNDNISFNARSSPLDRVTAALQSKALNFFMTHDLQLQMPEHIFESTILQVSPKHLDDNGLLTRFQIIPQAHDASQPRIFLKKIKKIIGEKLLNALLVVVLVLSLLAVKFLFMMPLIMGVAAAKKLVLKLVLFLFPFLTHIFKLCPYVEPHGLTKLHHHHHHVAHLHHVPPHHHPHEGPIIHETSYPPGHHHSSYHESGHHHHSSYPDAGVEFYSDGPEIGNEIITHHRKTDPLSIVGEENQIHSWAPLGQGQDKNRLKPHQMNRPLTAADIEKLALIAEKEAVLKVRLQQEHQRVLAENKQLQEQIKQGLKLQEKLKLQASVMQQRRQGDPVPKSVPMVPPGLEPSKPTIVYPDRQSGAGQQHNFYSQKEAFSQVINKGPEVITYDPFYSPILDKIDGILSTIGIKEEPCKERIICSMYKNPAKFSPHSNFLSAELSRDSSELLKPSATNIAIIRFYKYVQAARDGQDKRECLRLYPACSVNTEL